MQNLMQMVRTVVAEELDKRAGALALVQCTSALEECQAQLSAMGERVAHLEQLVMVYKDLVDHLKSKEKRND